MTDSVGVLERGKGAGWVAWEPERSRPCPCEGTRITEHRLNNAPGPTIALETVGSALANTNAQGSRGIQKRRHKPTDMHDGMS
jgi:hypothetical protein